MKVVLLHTAGVVYMVRVTASGAIHSVWAEQLPGWLEGCSTLQDLTHRLHPYKVEQFARREDIYGQETAGD